MTEYKKVEVAKALPAGTNAIGSLYGGTAYIGNIRVRGSEGDLAQVAPTLAAHVAAVPSLSTQAFLYGFDGIDWEKVGVDSRSYLKTSPEHSLKGKTMLYDMKQILNDSTVVRQVTGGKTYYLLQAGISVYSESNGGAGTLYVDDGTRLLLRVDVGLTATYNEHFSTHESVTYPHPLPIVAGTNIYVNASGANTTANGWIIGWEE